VSTVALRSRWVAAAPPALAGAAALGIATLRIADDAPGFSLALTAPSGATLLLAAGWSLTVAAIVFGIVRNVSTAVLLGAAGCAWFVAEWGNPAASAAVFSAGLVLPAVTPAVVAHLALAYPSGRLRSRRDRIVVLAGYVVLVGAVGVAPAVVYDPQTHGCTGCARNLLLAADDAETFTAIARIGVLSALVWSLVAVVVISTRLATSTAARRRAAAWAAVPSLGFLAAVSADYARSLDRGFLGADVTDARLWQVQALALVALAAAVLVDVVRGRLAHRSLTRIVVDLGRASQRGQLAATFAERLGDPSLRLAYPVGDGRYADADGVPVEPGDQRATPIRLGGTQVAAVFHRPGVLDSPEQIGDVVRATALGLDNERLRAQSLAQLADLRASGARVVAASDEERRGLERDLHDGTQQQLVGLLMAIRLAGSSRPDDAQLASARKELEKTIDELRGLAHGLYPVLLTDAGLRPALSALAETRHIRIAALPARRLPAVAETTVYRLIEQCSRAGGITVDVRATDARLVADIAVESMLDGAGAVADRVATLSGTLVVTSRAGAGHVHMSLPLTPGQPAAEAVISRVSSEVADPSRS
jgi:signal transduction histidine kinase